MAPLLNLFPSPDLNNNPNGDYPYASFQNTREDYGNGRFDHIFSAADSFFGRYTIDDATETRPDSFPQFHDDWLSRGQFVTLSAKNHIFSPTLLNSVRLFFCANRRGNHQHLHSVSGQQPDLREHLGDPGR